MKKRNQLRITNYKLRILQTLTLLFMAFVANAKPDTTYVDITNHGAIVGATSIFIGGALAAGFMVFLLWLIYKRQNGSN